MASGKGSSFLAPWTRQFVELLRYGIKRRGVQADAEKKKKKGAKKREEWLERGAKEPKQEKAGGSTKIPVRHVSSLAGLCMHPFGVSMGSPRKRGVR